MIQLLPLLDRRFDFFGRPSHRGAEFTAVQFRGGRVAQSTLKCGEAAFDLEKELLPLQPLDVL